MKKNIAILMSSLTYGGAERVAASYANWLIENTDNNVYIVKFDNENSAYELNKKITVINFNEQYSKNRIKAVYQRYKFCKKTFKKIKADIIFAMFYQTELYAYFSKPRKSILIGSERCNILERTTIEKLLSKFCAKRCHGFIFQTKEISNYFSKKVIQKSQVIPNAISNNKVYDIDIDNVKKENIITAMGRLTEQKGFDILIKAFELVNRKNPDYKLKIFGDGPDKEELQELIKKLKLEKKVILAGVNPNAVKEIARSKVFVLSSRYEGMPNALIESMAVGTACVSTDCKFGTKELIINGKNGLLVSVDNINELADKISHLIENDKLRNVIEKNAILIKEKLEPNMIYTRYYQYFKDVYNRKTKLEKLIDAIKNPKYLLRICAERGYFNKMDDRLYLKIIYWIKFNKKLNLKNPQTFNEKLQWLKIYNRKDIYTKMVDKYECREYIKEQIGEKYLIPLIGVYDYFDEIDFEKLPNQFVIKCNHDSGGLVICKDKSKLDIDAVREKINVCMKNNYYYSGREWPYKNVKPKIIIEELMNNNNKEKLMEYNLFCFNGEPKIVMACYGDKTTHRYNDFYDMNFKKLNFKCSYDASDKPLPKPKQLDEMIELSKKLSKDIPELRVDFYLCNDKIYMGELTFFHWSGFGVFEPIEWDLKLGKMIKLPKKSKK